MTTKSTRRKKVITEMTEKEYKAYLKKGHKLDDKTIIEHRIEKGLKVVRVTKN